MVTSTMSSNTCLTAVSGPATSCGSWPVPLSIRGFVMRHFVTVCFVLLVASCASAPAFARPHHYSRYHVVRNYHHTPNYRVARQDRSSFVYDRQAIGVAPAWVERTDDTSPGRRWVSRRTTRTYNIQTRTVAYSGTSRPSDCYGIQWCGCWLRHQFGLASKSLDLAVNWLGVGSPATMETGNVIVWQHHVGKYDGYRQGPHGREILLTSGNDGNAVRTRWFPERGLPGFRGYRRV